MIVDESLPLVTVLVPCRNEVRFIGSCLRSIVLNDYPESKLQVLVIDGCSDDGTPEIVKQFKREHRCVHLLSNPRRITPAALNVGIDNALGDYVLWMSAHNRYDASYIRTCVEWALKSGADNVGGIIVAEPRENTLIGKAITIALSHRFGNGGSKFRRTHTEPVWADTVFGGCYRRDVFAKVGRFNEQLVRGQDFEFNVRLHRAGLKTLLVPSIRSVYFARSTLSDFLNHNWANGIWAILPFRYSEVVPVSFRHLVPMLFVGMLLTLGVLGMLVPAAAIVALAILVAYTAVTVLVSIVIAVEQRDPRLILVMPVVFWSLHLTYGFGSLWAAVRSVNAIWRHASLALPIPTRKG